VLDEHTVLEDRDLAEVVGLTNQHDALDRLATCEELGLGQDRSTTTSGRTAFTPTLPLGLHARRAFDACDLVDRRTRPAATAGFADADDNLCGVVLSGGGVLAAATTTATTTAARCRRLLPLDCLGLFGLGVGVRLGLGLAVRRLLRAAVHVVRATATAPATTTATTTTRRAVGVFGVVVLSCVVLGCVFFGEVGLVVGLSLTQGEGLVLVDFFFCRVLVDDDLGMRQRGGDRRKVDRRRSPRGTARCAAAARRPCALQRRQGLLHIVVRGAGTYWLGSYLDGLGSRGDGLLGDRSGRARGRLRTGTARTGSGPAGIEGRRSSIRGGRAAWYVARLSGRRDGDDLSRSRGVVCGRRDACGRSGRPGHRSPSARRLGGVLR